ncbi:MAG: GntR family transcriptional regulator [Deltaproteobacteria bacterium]|nr:GntR family transcriptional regulator [Deltaproteobacteria bacterium]
MTEMAAAELRKAIRRGDLPPGTRLVPSTLEKELNLSRVSIREAIRELAGSGLVETITNVGAHVALPTTVEELREILEVRLVVEPKLVVEAVGKIRDEQMNILLGLCDEMEKEPVPRKGYFFLNQSFHQILYAASARKVLCRMTGQFMDQILLARSLGERSYLDFAANNEDHRKILDAVKAKDAGEITRIIRSHIQAGMTDVITIALNAG